MKRIIATVFIIVSLFALLAIPASASGKNLVTDKSNLITSSEEARINEALSAAERDTGMSIRVYIYEGIDEYYYTRYMDEHDTKNDLVLLVIQHDIYDGEYYYYLDTNGEPHTLISDKEVDRILDNPEVYDNIKSGNLAEGAIAFASLATEAVNGVLRPNIGRVLLVAVIIALCVAFVACLCVYISYRKKQHSPSYPLDKYARLNLIISRDIFVTKAVTRVRINTSSSGGGRSGGGGGGGRRGGR